MIINKYLSFLLNSEYKKMVYDDESLWSISLPNDADLITSIISKSVNNYKIFDAMAGIGGNTIGFAKYFKNVVSVEINLDRFELLKQNVEIYCNNTNVELINDTCINYLNNDYDVYFFDPPWGGINYKNNNKLSFMIDNYKLSDLVKHIRNINNAKIYFKLPNNYNFTEFDIFKYKRYYIRNYSIIMIN